MANVGSKVTVVSGSRLRRVSEDGKHLLDQRFYDGAHLEHDAIAEIKHVVTSVDGKIAYVVEMDYDGQKLHGWVYSVEAV